jgi:NSS family neurotransmitter:Na+ symporter|tara:strand:- start:235 stop:1608 length:1374 start_codon:yes stop_codon:yes gene_type:complete
MALQQKGMHGTWTSRWTFIMAATGSAVGLGNMWKFPYVAGSNGGGAFVLIYLGCILLIGVPVMMSEVLIGRNGRQSPINSMNEVVAHSNANSLWRSVGWIGVLAGLLILSFYAVIAGWALDYIFLISSGELQGINGESAAAAFSTLLSDPGRLIFWQSIFMGLCVAVVVGGVKKGLGIAVETLMPLLFIMLLMLLGFAIFKGNFSAAVSFLFSFDLEALTWRGVLEAMGQAFFTLSIGMGAIMAYGAYMPQNANIGKTILIVAFFDSSVAIISGLIIFSIVFATSGIEPSAGPGLMFISLPVAFGSMPGGLLIGAVFFVLVSIAAWSSAISLLEPCVAWLMEAKHIGRAKANLIIAGTAWILGLGSVFSFNIWAEYKVAGFTFFDFLDFLTANIMLPISGLLITLFVGYIIKRDVIDFEMQGTSARVMQVWELTIKYIAPFAIALVFIMGVYDKFFA